MNGMKLYIKKNKLFVMVVWFIMAFVCIGQLYDFFPMPSNLMITIESLVVFAIVNIYFAVDEKLKIFGFAHAHFLYASISAFGIGWVAFLIGRDSVYQTISAYSAGFLDNPAYGKAVVLSMLAFLTYLLSVAIGNSAHKEWVHEKEAGRLRDVAASRILADLGIAFIGFSFVVFSLFLISGRISLSMSYSEYMASIEGFSIYAYMLLAYEVGICFVVACGDATQKKIGITLFAAVAVIFFLTGNKGEVLYGLLACIGIYRYKGMKIKLKHIILLAILVFVVIPFITATRREGVLGGLSSIGASSTGFFVELGTQIRCTVYVLAQMSNGSRELIWGYSYYSPIMNILNRMIPFADLKIKPPASFDFTTTFASMGFNQIAEGYANFGVAGSCLYFFITGLFLSKNESKQMGNAPLGYLGAICAILINVSRNRFAFFFGHVFIVSVIYFGVTWMVARRSM